MPRLNTRKVQLDCLRPLKGLNSFVGLSFTKIEIVADS